MRVQTVRFVYEDETFEIAERGSGGASIVGEIMFDSVPHDALEKGRRLARIQGLGEIEPRTHALLRV